MAQILIFQLEIEDPSGDRRQFTLEESTALGRQVGNDLVLDDQRISRRHALIICSSEACALIDLDSSNGTYVNGERLPPNVRTPLESGAQIDIGSYRLTLQAIPVDKPTPHTDDESVGPEPPPASRASVAPEEPAPSEGPAVGGVPAVDDAPPPTGEPPDSLPRASDGDLPPLGLERRSRHLLQHLPGIYHTEFMSRFLGLFEAILVPIEWNVDNFDLYLSPSTAPEGFLPWLAGWFDLIFDPSWTISQQRELLQDAHKIYARRGTRWALSRVLEIYTGQLPDIVDTDSSLAPFTFKVILSRPIDQAQRELIERLIDTHKPAHTLYSLEVKRS